MLKPKFLILLLFISLLGLILRLWQYDAIPPFSETKDEFIYPWAGMTLLQTGIPESWSPFVSYPNKYHLKVWGENFPMVKPYIEKPFLYPLLTGSWMLVNGATDFNDVRLSTLRLMPIALSILTILFVGLLTRQMAGEKSGLLAAGLYATMPVMVLANRLSLTENLLTPLILLAAYFLIAKRFVNHSVTVHFLGILSGLAIQTKQIGFILPLGILIILGRERKWKAVGIVAAYTLFFAFIQYLFISHFGLELFLKVSEELRRAHALGLPEAIITMLRFPGIGHKESFFPDGGLLAGLILLLSTPFWSNQTPKQQIVWLFPFLYLLFIVLGEGGQTWYGWHIFPLFPFAIIALSLGLQKAVHEFNLSKLIFIFALLATSSVRFICLSLGTANLPWQSLLLGIFVFMCIPLVINFAPFKKKLIITLLLFYVFTNVYTVISLPEIYPMLPQPL